MQVTSRRGWGAYRLRWSLIPALMPAESVYAPSSSSGATSRSTRAGWPTTTVRARYVAQHDRAGADEGVLADLDAGQQDGRAADAGAAAHDRALHERRRRSVRPMKLSFVVTTQGAMKTSSSSSQ